MFDEATSLTFRKVEPLSLQKVLWPAGLWACGRSYGQLDFSPICHIKGSHYRVSKLDCLLWCKLSFAILWDSSINVWWGDILIVLPQSRTINLPEGPVASLTLSFREVRTSCTCHLFVTSRVRITGRLPPATYVSFEYPYSTLTCYVLVWNTTTTQQDAKFQRGHLSAPQLKEH